MIDAHYLVDSSYVDVDADVYVDVVHVIIDASCYEMPGVVDEKDVDLR